MVRSSCLDAQEFVSVCEWAPVNGRDGQAACLAPGTLIKMN